jgi:dimethylargininase
LLQHAIVRTPSINFGQGLTTAGLGAPDHDRALAQHEAYCAALERCGLALERLDPDPRHPDSTFVEDTAVLIPGLAVIARPGAESRAGETSAIRAVLARSHAKLEVIAAPGTLDGGDVCEAGGHFFIGLSERTNEEGARQLAAVLERSGRTSALVDVRGVEGILHLKSGLACVGEGRCVAIGALARHPALRGREIIPVEPGEEYGANCLRVNGRVLVAAGHPRLERTLRGLGYDTIPLEMSEFRKMDGGLSCLSLRY